MIRTISLNYRGLELECKGYYSPYKDNGWDNPPEHECFEIDSICYKNTDVTELIYALDFDLSEIECLCIEHFRD